VTQRTHYKILGLADFAPFSAVECAYQRLLINAKEHPINPDIQEIYHTLITPHLRHNYDILLYKSKQDRVRWVMNFAVIAFAGISDYNFPNFTNSLYDLSSWIKRITEDFNAYYHKKLLNGYREYQYYLSSISNTDAEENLKDEIDILRKEIYHFAKLPFLLACMHDEADLNLLTFVIFLTNIIYLVNYIPENHLSLLQLHLQLKKYSAVHLILI